MSAESFCLQPAAAADTPVETAPDSLTADLVKVSTPQYHADLKRFKPKLGIFTYEAGWQGIPAAQMDVEVDTDGMHYFVNVTARTNSAIDVFYRLRYTANGILEGDTLLPLKSTFDQKENSKSRITEITYLDNGEVRSYRKRDDREPETLQFTPNNLMLDPFSAAFLSRSLDWKLNDERKLDVFNGKTRYLITFTAIDKTQIEVNGVKRDVWVISPKIENLTNTKNNKKFREARIYVTADADRELLKIESEVYVGTVSATLVAYTPTGPAADTAMARSQQKIFLK